VSEVKDYPQLDPYLKIFITSEALLFKILADIFAMFSFDIS